MSNLINIDCSARLNTNYCYRHANGWTVLLHLPDYRWPGIIRLEAWNSHLFNGPKLEAAETHLKKSGQKCRPTIHQQIVHLWTIFQPRDCMLERTWAVKIAKLLILWQMDGALRWSLWMLNELRRFSNLLLSLLATGAFDINIHFLKVLRSLIKKKK